ncbi:hypothetical protein DNTS_000339 [Danionella cerebrum]|uniref:Uncharacterized protein n=1 Tax=Danionella cerebrum TaxID=2873325 RepID=A0A553R5U3_9TELE|nr:hypothetical protein DNTS_000339 [Danionella translucida]
MLPFLLCALLTSVGATVTELTVTYNCAEEGSHGIYDEYAAFNGDCEQYWSVEDLSVGTYQYSRSECQNPCVELSVGRINLTDCINITLAVTCSKGNLTERRVNFIGLLLGLITFMMTVGVVLLGCYYKRRRNNAQLTDPSQASEGLLV